MSLFPTAGTHLIRYAAALSAVEINSSFYRPHRPATYARWASSVPENFRFAVKIPKLATHERRLVDVSDVLDRFLSEVTSLGGKLGPLLIQLPPTLSFTSNVAEDFFAELRSRFDGKLALEPRHASWFEADSEQVLIDFQVARVAADPAVVPAASKPGGWSKLCYYRLHGSPKMYYSAYTDEVLDALTTHLTQATRVAETWCIFDNTAEGAATVNAVESMKRLETGK